MRSMKQTIFHFLINLCVKDFFEVERVQSHVNKRKEPFRARVKRFYIGNQSPIYSLSNIVKRIPFIFLWLLFQKKLLQLWRKIKSSLLSPYIKMGFTCEKCVPDLYHFSNRLRSFGSVSMVHVRSQRYLRVLVKPQ